MVLYANFVKMTVLYILSLAKYEMLRELTRRCIVQCAKYVCRNAC